MNVFTRGIRNAFRNSVRSFAIIIILGLSTGLALAMLIARQAVNNKIELTKSSIGNTISIQPAGFSSFSQANNALTTSQLSPISKLPHVISISESLTDRLINNTSGQTAPSFGRDQNSNGNNTTNLTSPIQLKFSSNRFRGFVSGGGSIPTNFSPPITIVGTTTPLTINSTNINIASGTSINGNQDTNNALVSQNMASKNNLTVGSTFTAYNSTLTVAGIFSSSNQAISNDIIVALPTEQRLSGQSGVVTSAIVTVDSLDNLSSVTSQIKSQLGSAADVTSAVDAANAAVAPLNGVKSTALYSLIGSVVAGAIIVFLTMVMIVRERRREIGVLKAIGASNIKVISQFVVEAVTLTLVGALIGIGIGALASHPITNALVTSASSSTTGSPGGFGRGGRGFGGGFARGLGNGAGFVRSSFSNIQTVVGWDIILYGLITAIVIAILASTAVAFVIAKVRPAEVMRAE